MLPQLTWEELRALCSPDGGPLRVRSQHEASRFCHRWARQHYENFPVATLWLPTPLRRHVAHLYAFARLADDIADHPTASPSEKLALLEELEHQLTEALLQPPSSGNPVLVAFSATLHSTGLPFSLVHRLLTAFRYDACFRPFGSWGDLTWYCHHSANPIGEALLLLHRSCTPAALCASNALCTALQVLNFWQDLSLDLRRGRLYIPRELLQKHGLADPAQLWGNSVKLQRCLADMATVLLEWLSHATRGLSAIGHPRLRWQVRITLAAAFRLLDRLRRLGPAVLHRRIQLGLRDVGALLWRLGTLRRL